MKLLIYPQTVTIFWSNRIRKIYESKGYKWTKQGDPFEVDINDLPDGTTQTVLFSCASEDCFEIFPIQWRYYKERKDPNSPSYCPQCKRRSGADPTIMKDRIEEEFEKSNYILLNKHEYMDNNSRLRYICRKHRERGIQNTTWRSFNVNKSACFFCACEKISLGNTGKIQKNNTLLVGIDPKTLFENLKKMFQERNYTLLPDQEIRNRGTVVYYICPKHNEFGPKTIRLDHFLNGVGCSECATDNLRKTMSYEELVSLFNEHDATLLPDQTYRERKQVFKYICNKHADFGIQQVRIDHLMDRNSLPCKPCWKEFKSSLTGELAPRWQGGLTKLSYRLRDEIEPWRHESMKQGGYKCVLTNSSNIVVHHLYPFHKIVSECLEINNLQVRETVGMYSDEELSALIETLRKLHEVYGLGVCLEKQVHKLFHRLYGFDTSEADFYDFKDRFEQGEFDEYLN